MDTRGAIKQNLVYLAHNITNLSEILLHLEQNGTISQNEREEIEAEKTTQTRNSKLLGILQRKELPIDIFLEILSASSNSHCVEKIAGLPLKTGHSLTNKFDKRNPVIVSRPTVSRILKNKWWPDKKRLIKSLHERKIEGRFIIEELNDRISADENRMIVVCESLEAFKLTGMGGVGKTLTATWYGHCYEEEYNHVIWIDCGEDSLLHSFENLARDLDIRNRQELSTIEQISRKCYEALEEFKCLWILDNAESYKGEGGIKEVLPKYKENFYCVITSRSLDWGTPNIGHGKISRLELSIFGESESLEFLKTHLNEEMQHTTEYELKELCSLLGNLPLALQLSVAALNQGKIDLQNYIKETSSKDLGNIVDAAFDDYEKTINGNVKISLNLIGKEKNGKIANDILTVLGYIRPDNIQSKFLMKILNLELNILNETIDLLEKYSLVCKTGTIQETQHNSGIKNRILGRSRVTVEMDLLNIHRLLQQVIRHNCRKSEDETLRKILSCNGFLDCKIIPFMKYANDELRKEFPKVKTELLDQQQLRKLLKEKRFEESAHLANFIDRELTSATTKFNYAVCLGENGQLEEAVNVLTPLFMKHKITKDATMPLEILSLSNKLPLEYGKIVDLSGEPTHGQIDYLRFHLYFRLGKSEDVLMENVHEVLQIVSKSILNYVLQEKRYGESALLAKYIDQEINTNTTKFNYAMCLQKNQQWEENTKVLEELYNKEIKEKMDYDYDCVEMVLMKLEKEVTKELIGGHLLVSHWKMGNKERVQEILKERKSFKIIDSEEMSTLLGILIYNLIESNYTLTNNYAITTFKIALGWKGKTKRTELRHCSANLSVPLPSGLQELVIEQVHFHNNGNANAANKIDLSQWLPKKLHKLEITYHKHNQIILSLESIVSIENIILSNCSLSLDSVNRISPTELELFGVSFVENGKALSTVNVSEFINFHKMKRLEFSCDSKKKNVSIDLSKKSANMEYLRLYHVKIVSLKSADDNGRISIKEAKIENCSLDLSILPPSLEKLSLSFRTKVLVNGEIELPNLKYLQLKSTSILPHFRSIKLIYLYLVGVKELNLDLLPTSTTIRIDKYVSRNKPLFFPSKTKLRIKLQGAVVHLDKLILDGFRLNEVEEMLPYFQVKQLVLFGRYNYSPHSLLQLVDKQVPTIAIGEIIWWNGDFQDSVISKHVDRQSQYYLFHEGKGKAIEQKDFEELYLLEDIF